MGNVAAFIAKSLERGAVGVPISRKAASPAKRLPCKSGNRKVCETTTLMLTEPLRLRHLPYLRSARGRGGHCNIASTATIKDRKNDHSTINSQP